MYEALLTNLPNSVQPGPLMVSLIRSSNSRMLNGLPISSLRPHDAQECTDYAMTVSLFSVSYF